MNRQYSKDEELIMKKLKNLKRKKPDLTDVEVSYQTRKVGGYKAKITARLRKHTLFLSEEGKSLTDTISKIFNKFNRVLDKKKYKRKSTFHLREAS